MGKAHLDALLQAPNACAAAVADPPASALRHVERYGIQGYSDYCEMLEKEHLDGVVIAAPNAEHASIGLACIERNIAVLIEKPISESLQTALTICRAAAARSVPILVGHHRRHNSAVQLVRKSVTEGRIGRAVAANILDVKLKPPSYFVHAWRSEPEAGGPILINMIHEIDLMRFIFGEIRSVQAISSNAVRNLQVEDTATVLMKFDNGAIGTIAISDTTATPFSWDLAAGEFDLIADVTAPIERQDVPTHVFGGTLGCLTLPTPHHFTYRGLGEPGWRSSMSQAAPGSTKANTCLAQMAHFARVCLGEEAPLVSGIDGARTLEVTLAVKESAATGRAISFDSVEDARS
jgi:predicted dehydrogenase